MFLVVYSNFSNKNSLRKFTKKKVPVQNIANQYTVGNVVSFDREKSKPQYKFFFYGDEPNKWNGKRSNYIHMKFSLPEEN